jgi:hypothetical protein
LRELDNALSHKKKFFIEFTGQNRISFYEIETIRLIILPSNLCLAGFDQKVYLDLI